MPISAGAGAGLAGFAEGFANSFTDVFVKKHLAKKQQDAEMKRFLLSSALKGEVPFDSEEVKKSAKTFFGADSDTFMRVGQAIATHQLGMKNDADALLISHLQANPDTVEGHQQAFTNYIQEAAKKGIPIPQEHTSLFGQLVAAPSISAGKAGAVEPIHVRETAEKTAARMGVEYSPEGVALKAGSAEAVGAAGARGRTSVTEPLARGRESRRAAAALAKEERAKQAEIEKERRLQAAKPIAGNAIKWQNAKGENPPANLTVGEAVTQGYHPVDPKESGFLSSIGLGPTPKKVGAGTHYDPDQNAADKAMFPGIFGPQ